MAASETQRSQAAALLACSQMKQGEIAEEVGVSVRTVRRWLTEPEFIERVDGFALAAETEIRARLRSYGATFVDALGEVAATGEGQHGTGRATAAKHGLSLILGERREIRHSGSVGDADTARMAALEAEAAALRAELGEE
jgi:hypothetical protein